MTFQQYFHLTEASNPPVTFGELKQAIKNAANKKFVGKVATQVAGFVPGLDTATGIVDSAATLAKQYLDPSGPVINTLKKFMSVADNVRGTNILSKLDIDDEASSIVADEVEDEFVKFMILVLNEFPDNQPIPPDWNMTKELVRYLSYKYKGRTLSIPESPKSTPIPSQ